MEKRERTGPIRRFAELSVRAVEGQTGQYELAVSSEQPCSRWFGVEVLDHSPGAVDLSRMGDVAPLLYAHGRDPVVGTMPIGRVARAWLDEVSHQVRAVVEFDPEDETSERIRSKMERGMLRGVSIGYQVEAWRELRDGETGPNGRTVGPAELATRWSIYEISLEPTPADATVGFGKSVDALDAAAETKEDLTMEEMTNTRMPVESQDRLNTQEERLRCADILDLCRQFEEDPAPYIRDGVTVDGVRAAILKHLADRSVPVKAAGAIEVTQDETDKLRSAAVDGILLRSGVQLERPADGALDFRGMRLDRLAEECLERSGEGGARRLDRTELLRRSLTPTSQFGAILSGVVNVAMATGYQEASTTYQLWTGRGSTTDFRPTEIWQISEAGDLVQVPQGGEIPFDELNSQRMATRQLLTYAKQFGLTREAFLNDNIDLITKLPMAYARAARRGINRAVYQVLRGNPVMADGKALFSAEHKNLGTGAAPVTGSFGEALGLMRRQRNLGGNEVLNLTPRFVLAPSSLEVPVRQLLVSTSDPSAVQSGVSNVFQGYLTPVIDAELDGLGGETAYFFAASPTECDTIEVSYLNGQDAPILETREDWDRLGYRFRIYMDYGVTLVDHRGLVKNPGATKA